MGHYVFVNRMLVNYFTPMLPIRENNVFRPYTSHFHYYCRDHLGDNRVVVSEEGGIAKAKAEMVKKKLEKDDD